LPAHPPLRTPANAYPRVFSTNA